jgi:hypothetical protein
MQSEMNSRGCYCGFCGSLGHEARATRSADEAPPLGSRRSSYRDWVNYTAPSRAPAAGRRAGRRVA